MATTNTSPKRLQINKANSMMVIAVAVAAFLVSFSIVASRSLLARRSYQARVIAAQQKARDQLQANLATVDGLVNSYKAFVAQPTNVIGGSATGDGNRDGDNARIILDALPSKYDFPGLTSSLDKTLHGHSFKVTSITGTDDELVQANNQGSPSPQPIEIPFQLGAEGNYKSVQDLLGLLEDSIRPIKIESLGLSGTDSELQVTIKAKTYYQPEKALSIKKEVVK